MVCRPVEPGTVIKIIDPEGVWASIAIALRAKQKAPATANFKNIRFVYVMAISFLPGYRKFLVTVHKVPHLMDALGPSLLASPAMWTLPVPSGRPDSLVAHGASPQLQSN